MSPHLDVDLLAALDAGLLDPADARPVRAAAEADPVAAHVLDALATTRAELAAAPALSVPADVLARWTAAVSPGEATSRGRGVHLRIHAGPVGDAPADAPAGAPADASADASADAAVDPGSRPGVAAARGDGAPGRAVPEPRASRGGVPAPPALGATDADETVHGRTQPIPDPAGSADIAHQAVHFRTRLIPGGTGLPAAIARPDADPTAPCGDVRAPTDPESSARADVRTPARPESSARATSHPTPHRRTPPAGCARRRGVRARTAAATSATPPAAHPAAHLAGRRPRSRLRRVVVAAAILAGLAGLTALPAAPPEPAARPAPAPRLAAVDLVAAGEAAIGTVDAGPLADPARRTACLTAVAPDAAAAPLLGARRVVLDDRAGVLLVLGTGQRGRIRLVVVDPDCGPLGGTLLADRTIGG